MIKRLILLAFWLAPCVAFACEVVDDAGNRVVLTQPAQRIVSLAPDMTEVLFATGAGSKIVGVMQGSDYPAAAANIPIVASYSGVNIERLLELQPDLIVVWSEGHLADSLKKFHIPIFYSHQRKVTTIPSTLRRLGCLAGTQAIANQAANQFEKKYQLLQKQYANKKSVTVFYQVWSKPLITIGESSWINDVITLCGGKNIFANLKGAAPQVSLEEVLIANPEAIIGSLTNWENSWRQWQQVNAVKNNNLIAINPDLVERASPRILVGAENICKKLDAIRQQGLNLGMK